MKQWVLPLLLIIGLENVAAESYGNAVVSEIVSTYDGDTFRATIKDYPKIVGDRINIRIYGIDTPELRDTSECIKDLARKAKEYTETRLKHGRKIELINMQRGKYFRIVASVFVDGQDLGEELIKKGLAKPYFGEKKEPWLCTSE